MKRSVLHLAFLGALALALAPRQAAAHSGDATARAHGVIVHSDGSGSDKQSHTVEIRTDDGKVQVRVDGKEIPADRFRFDGGRVVILDENGKEMKGIGLFVNPDEHAAKVQAELEAMDQAPPPVMLGVQMSEPGEALQKHLHLEPGQSSLVYAIYEGLPAQQGGLEQYDIIVAINGKRPAGPKEVREFLLSKAAGDTVRLTVIHEGQTVERTVKLEAFDADRMKAAHAQGNAAGEGGAFAWAAPGQGFQLKGLFDPNQQQWYKWLQESPLADQIKEELRGQLPQDLDDRLERLDERIDEIKKLIDALIEQAREIARDDGKKH